MVLALLFLANWRNESERITAVYLRAQELPGDQVESLIAFVRAEETPVRDKSTAIMLLGELRDPRALETLEPLYTGAECDHQRFVCQRELGKAIDRVSGKAPPQPWLMRRLNRWMLPEIFGEMPERRARR